MPGGARTVPVRSGFTHEGRLQTVEANPLFVRAADGDRPRSGGDVRMRPPTTAPESGVHAGICLAECGRPRPQQVPLSPARGEVRTPSPFSALLRPRTATLR